MAKWDRIEIKHHMSPEKLNERIKTLEKDVKVLNRLHFIRNRYLGDSVELAASKSGVTKHVRTILRDLGMKFAKPHLKDYRRPPDAKKQLKKLRRTS